MPERKIYPAEILQFCYNFRKQPCFSVTGPETACLKFSAGTLVFSRKRWYNRKYSRFGTGKAVPDRTAGKAAGRMEHDHMENNSALDRQSAQHQPDISEPAPAPHGPQSAPHGPQADHTEQIRARTSEPVPHGPERSAHMSEPRVEPQRIDPHKVLAYAERRAARHAQDEELKALAYLALIRSGMEERHKQMRKDNSAERKPTQEELDAQLRSIIEESDGH